MHGHEKYVTDYYITLQQSCLWLRPFLPFYMSNIFILFCFQEFMRRIPGSLLCCELYEEWLDAVDEDDEEEEQVEDVQRYVFSTNLLT